MKKERDYFVPICIGILIAVPTSVQLFVRLVIKVGGLING